MSLNDSYPEIELELSKLPQGKDWLRPDVKITYTPIAGDSSSDEDDDVDTDEQDGMEMDEDEDEQPGSSRMTRSQTRKKQQEEFVEPDAGWTTVRTKRK